ncbi:MAG: carbohydrate ABC transporter substrate-binding protein [Lachnospiraceae bacterium]|nr:carbohydrate ABC transporter substrate-binding protein [Lachnospiraceae bacterium]
MKMKKVMALVLAGMMTVSLAACGGKDTTPASDSSADNTNTETTTPADESNTGDDATADETPAAELSGNLTIWTLAVDLEDMGKKFAEENPGVTVDTTVIAPADYPTKVDAAIGGGDTSVDIIVGEPQMLQSMFEAGYFEDLNQAPYNAQDYADKIVDYVWEVGQDADGIQRAISYQITPAGFYYRRDIAQEVFGTDDPEEIGKLFADYDTIIETGKTLKEKGYRIFASDAETNYFSGDSAWVVDGKLNVSQSRYDYMDMVVALYQNDLTAYAAQWTAPWYQGMSGPVPILSADIMWGDWGENEEGVTNLNVWDAENFNANVGNYTDQEAEVFAYGLPAWGVLTMRDNVGETSGKWGVCSGPAYGFGGGTFIGISSLSENKELAWEFIKWATLNENTADWWIEFSQGDTVSLIPALEKHADDGNEIYGGQHLYSFWLEQAEGIDYSKVTQYDTAIGDAWGQACTAVKEGTKSKEEAVNEFYDSVAATYPDLIIER